jgi:hypothetical protein
MGTDTASAINSVSATWLLDNSIGKTNQPGIMMINSYWCP